MQARTHVSPNPNATKGETRLSKSQSQRDAPKIPAGDSISVLFVNRVSNNKINKNEKKIGRLISCVCVCV